MSLRFVEVRPRQKILVDADSALDFTTPPEEMTQRKVRLQRVIVDLGHAHEQFQCVIGLAIQDEVQTP